MRFARLIIKNIVILGSNILWRTKWRCDDCIDWHCVFT